jgi:hypothetical protein
MVVPVTRHEAGRSTDEDGPSLPAAFIWLSDSTEIGSCGADAAAAVGGVPVAEPVLSVVGTGVEAGIVAAGRDACRLAGPQPATSRVPMAAAAAAAAKLIERMHAIFGRYGEIVMGSASLLGRASLPAAKRTDRGSTERRIKVPATLRVAHKVIGAEVRRGAFDVVLDGKPVGSVEKHGTFETPVEPGRHTVQIRNGRRNSSQTAAFDAAEGQVIAFRFSGKNILPVFLLSFAVPSLAISLKRE